MRAGNLFYRITVQRRTIEAGRANVPVETWSDAFSCWAEVREVSARERTEAPKEMAERTATFTIRWRYDVDETMRIVWDDRTWDITGIRRINRREGIEISAESILVD